MKAFYKSKTFWFNGVTVLLTVLSFYGYTPNDALAQQVSSLLLVVSPVVNLALRLVTDKKITLK